MEKIKSNKTADVIEEEEIVKNCAAIIYLGKLVLIRREDNVTHASSIVCSWLRHSESIT